MQIKYAGLPINNQVKFTPVTQMFNVKPKPTTPVRGHTQNASFSSNASPINMKKMVLNIHKSPYNKENRSYNAIPAEQTFKAYNTHALINHRANQSPILALARPTYEEGRKVQNKVLTPQNHKIVANYQDLANKKKDKQKQTLMNSKNSKIFFSTTNFGGRCSSSFKDLLQNRSLTPNRPNDSELSFPQQTNYQKMKQSSSFNQLFGKQTHQKMVDNRPMSKYRPGSTLSEDPQSNQLKCVNNDGMKAKYRVSNRQDDQDCEQMQLYYCSLCTIPLVQQGFLVQPLQNENSCDSQSSGQQTIRKINQYRFHLANKQSNLQRCLNEIGKKEANCLKQINNFYNTAIQYLQKQRVNDCLQTEEYFKNKVDEPYRVIQQIKQQLQNLEEETFNYKNQSEEQIASLLQINQNYFTNQIYFEISSKELFTSFQQHFQSIIKSKLIQNSKNQIESPHISNAMRFSFQKVLTDINSKKIKMHSIMNPLQQQQQDIQNEPIQHNKQRTPFRDLFPQIQDSERSNNPVLSPTFKHI